MHRDTNKLHPILLPILLFILHQPQPIPILIIAPEIIISRNSMTMNGRMQGDRLRIGLVISSVFELLDHQL
jgi:hypothetical protein